MNKINTLMANNDEIKINLNELVNQFIQEPEPLKNSPEMPQNSFRWVIVGSSGAGKSYALISAILEQRIKFDKLYCFCRDPNEAKYQVLFRYLKTLEEEYYETTGDAVELFVVSTNVKDIPLVESLDRTSTKLFIFDDMLCESKEVQTLISNYFVLSRHYLCSCVYLAQNFYSLPKILRMNSNYISLYKLNSNKDLSCILSDVNVGMDLEEFKSFYRKAVEAPRNFLFIDLKTPITELRLRKNFGIA